MFRFSMYNSRSLMIKIKKQSSQCRTPNKSFVVELRQNTFCFSNCKNNPTKQISRNLLKNLPKTSRCILLKTKLTGMYSFMYIR